MLMKKLLKNLFNSSLICLPFHAVQNMKQHDVMSLEMAQYEETICDLQSQVAEFQVLVQEGDVKAESLEKKIAELYEDRRTTEQVFYMKLYFSDIAMCKSLLVELPSKHLLNLFKIAR